MPQQNLRPVQLINVPPDAQRPVYLMPPGNQMPLIPEV